MPDALATPSVKRRLTCMVYEAMLLFGVVAVTGGLFSVLLDQRHALYLRHAQQAWLFIVLGVYFLWLWTHGGQTLPMKTWRIRLISANGRPVGFRQALARFLLSWLWFIPGLVLAWALGAKTWMLAVIPFANIVLWALTAFLDPQRQFLHDRLAGTRLVLLPAAASMRSGVPDSPPFDPS